MVGSVLEKTLPLWRRHAHGLPDARREARAGRSGRRSGPGLSKAHISPQDIPRPPYRLETWDGGALVRVCTPYLGDRVPALEEPRRGEITDWTGDSQRRLRVALAKVPDAAMGAAFMVTLTYPGLTCPEAIPAPDEAARYKGHLDAFGKALQRQWAGSSAVWVLEFQKRLVPHYHLLVFGVSADSLLECRQWVASTWNRIVGGDDVHLRAGTQCDKAKHPGGARNYLAKYLSKGSQAMEGVKVGRYWGVIGRKFLPLATERVEPVTKRQAVVALRIARKLSVCHRWESAWKRFHNRVAAGNDHFGRLSLVEFRQMCEAFRRGRRSWTFSVVMSDGSTAEGVLTRLGLVAALNGGDITGRVAYPQRPRVRNNSSVNLFCRASEFRAALDRCPVFVDGGGSVAGPRPVVAGRPGRSYVISSDRRRYRSECPF